MNQKFRDLVASLEPKHRVLLEMEPVRFGSLPKEIPERGIYVFSEGGQHLYVGRTNGIRRRLQNHCRLSGTHHTATFAFRIARQTTGQTRRLMRRPAQETSCPRIRSSARSSRGQSSA